MADVCVLSVGGSRAVSLKPDHIYRIGKQSGSEIYIADESLELAHGVVILLRTGIVRLLAVTGLIFVNGEEKQRADIRKKDARDGKVKLRFGKVEASLQFFEEGHDSSGFGECVKIRSPDTTEDSFCIPETQPPCENTAGNTTADSFYVPETQAIVFERPTAMGGKVSLGEDLVIPETENEPDEETESSGLGSQIRICTQDFNELNEDAIDDFDSSLMVDDALRPLCTKGPPIKLEKNQDNLLDATDLEMTALNWSATNSKCRVLNSTKADEDLRLDACITPELSAPLADANRDISTPDIIELMDAHDQQQQAAVRSNASTPQLCGIKQLVVATIETPRSTQNEEDEASKAPDIINQDFVATQAFPSRLPQAKESPLRFAQPKESPLRIPQPKEYPDFIATQVFPGNGNIIKAEEDIDDQDFVATQAFPSRLPQPKEDHERQVHSPQTKQDFIETQPFHVLQTKSAKLGNQENIRQDRLSTDSLSDEIEEILNEMTSGNVVSSPLSSPDEEALKYVKPGVVKDQNHDRKVSLFENVFPNAGKQKRWQNELLVELKRYAKRVASTDGQPPSVTPSKNRRLSEQAEILNASYSAQNCSIKSLATFHEGNKSDPVIASTVASVSQRAEQRIKVEPAEVTFILPPNLPLETKQVKRATRSQRNEAKSQRDNLKESTPEVQCDSSEKNDGKSPSKIAKRDKPEEDAEQSDSKSGQNKTIDSDKKDSEDIVPKRRVGRPRKRSVASAEASTVTNALNTSVSASDPDDIVSVKLENPLFNKIAVVRLKRTFCEQLKSTAVPVPKTDATAVKEEDSWSSTSQSQSEREDALRVINKFVRKVKSTGKIKVALTMCHRKALEPAIKTLKHVIEITEDPQECDVLVMDKGERTYKFLVAIALSKPVLNSRWLQSIILTKTICIREEHLFDDTEFIKVYKFNPLRIREQRRLLRGINFMLCKGIKPNVTELKAIIQSAGGRVFSRAPSVANTADLYVVAASKDERTEQRLRHHANVHYITTEAVMRCLVRQNVQHLDMPRLAA